MPRRAKIVSNEKRKKMAAKHLKLRQELRGIVKNTTLKDDDRWAAQDKLQKLPRNSCENRVRNRCSTTLNPFFTKINVMADIRAIPINASTIASVGLFSRRCATNMREFRWNVVRNFGKR